jgi:threonine aldolase
MLAEAVLFLRPGLAEGFPYGRKQGMQLVSKMRFLSAQVVALLEDDLWLDLARHANAMGQRLAEAVGDHVEIVHPAEANAVFARVEDAAIPLLRAAGAYTPWDADVVRWMTSWDTTPDEVDAFAESVRLALA